MNTDYARLDALGLAALVRSRRASAAELLAEARRRAEALVPSMNLPLHWSPDGLPIGVIFTARFGAEAVLLRLGRQLEEARPWADRLPALVERQETA